jgi:hypothetical protein
VPQLFVPEPPPPPSPPFLSLHSSDAPSFASRGPLPVVTHDFDFIDDTPRNVVDPYSDKFRNMVTLVVEKYTDLDVNDDSSSSSSSSLSYSSSSSSSSCSSSSSSSFLPLSRSESVVAMTSTIFPLALAISSALNYDFQYEDDTKIYANLAYFAACSATANEDLPHLHFSSFSSMNSGLQPIEAFVREICPQLTQFAAVYEKHRIKTPCFLA